MTGPWTGDWTCHPACGPMHWCIYCALENRPPTHTYSISHVYWEEQRIASYPACADHHGREIPPIGATIRLPES